MTTRVGRIDFLKQSPWPIPKLRTTSQLGRCCAKFSRLNPGTINELAGGALVLSAGSSAWPTNIEPSSTLYSNEHLRGQERVLDICAREGATLYINAFGGHELYSREAFASHGIALRFLRSRLPPYRQFNHHFVPGLSFLDILMFNPPEDIRLMLREFDLA